MGLFQQTRGVYQPPDRGGDGRIRLSGCFTGACLGLSCCWYWGTGGGTTAGESRAISHISTKLFEPSAILTLDLNEQAVTLAVTLAIMLLTLAVKLLTLIACIHLGEHSHHHTT